MRAAFRYCLEIHPTAATLYVNGDPSNCDALEQLRECVGLTAKVRILRVALGEHRYGCRLDASVAAGREDHP